MSRQGYMCCCGNHTQIHWPAAVSASLTATTVAAGCLFSRPQFSAAWTPCVCPLREGEHPRTARARSWPLGLTPFLPLFIQCLIRSESHPSFPAHSPLSTHPFSPDLQVHILQTPQSTPSLLLADELDKLLLLRGWWSHFPWSASGSSVWVQDESAFSNTLGQIYFSYKWNCCLCLLAKLCSTLLQPHGLYSLRGSSVLRIFQARILEWVAISFSRSSSRPRDWTHASCIGRWILYHWATRKAHKWNYCSQFPCW